MTHWPLRSTFTSTLFALALALASVMGSGRLKAETPQQARETDTRAQQLERSLRQAESAQKTRQGEADDLSREADALQERLQDSARRAKKLEDALDAGGRHLDVLVEQEQGAVQALETQRAKLAGLLGAVENLERARPPALLVTPDRAVDAVRSAILLDDLLPHVIRQTQILAADLKNLQNLRQEITAEQATLAMSEAVLAKERHAIETVLAQKLARQSAAETALRQGAAAIADKTKEIASLKGLIAALSHGLPPVTPKPDMGQDLALRTALPADIRPGNLNHEGMLQHGNTTYAFSQAKGSLKLPSPGRILRHFGESDSRGQSVDGLIISTRAQAQVVTPFDGKIVFAGPFLDRPQLLLIEAGEGYHILLSGMAVIYGRVGDRLLAGEPVGMMPGSSGSDLPQNQPSGPELYLEFRKDGTPINPLPWLAADEKKVSG